MRRSGVVTDGRVIAPYSEPDTSKAAAIAALPHVETLTAIIYDAIRRAGREGRCNHELRDECGILLQTVCPIVWTLVGDGLVVDSGLRRLTPSRRKAKAWVLAPTRQLALPL